mgnify:CR=1 FL=1
MLFIRVFKNLHLGEPSPSFPVTDTSDFDGINVDGKRKRTKSDKYSDSKLYLITAAAFAFLIQTSVLVFAFSYHFISFLTLRQIK